MFRPYRFSKLTAATLIAVAIGQTACTQTRTFKVTKDGSYLVTIRGKYIWVSNSPRDGTQTLLSLVSNLSRGDNLANPDAVNGVIHEKFGTLLTASYAPLYGGDGANKYFSTPSFREGYELSYELYTNYPSEDKIHGDVTGASLSISPDSCESLMEITSAESNAKLGPDDFPSNDFGSNPFPIPCVKVSYAKLAATLSQTYRESGVNDACHRTYTVRQTSQLSISLTISPKKIEKVFMTDMLPSCDDGNKGRITDDLDYLNVSISGSKSH